MIFIIDYGIHDIDVKDIVSSEKSIMKEY